MTAPEKGRWYWAKNWLHYHWLYLIVAAVALWVGISWLGNALHWGETLPDYQIAYVGKRSLPDDTAHAIENAFAQYGEDLNGDGAVCVRLNQYVSDTEDKENASTYALAAVLCTGCGVKDEDLKSDPLVNADGTAPVGSTLVAPAPQDDFVLLDNKDILSANGLYYASWVNGDAQPYENSEGKTVDLYDAQLTLVVQENKTEDKAASAVEGWQTLAQQNYDISDTQTLTAAGQEYTVIQFTYQDESNPYATGVAAFAQRGTSAIEWELSCQDSYSGDALKVLTDFLNSCTY